MNSESDEDYSEDFEGFSRESSPVLGPTKLPDTRENPQTPSEDVFTNRGDDSNSSPQLLSYSNGQKNGTLNKREEATFLGKELDSSQEVTTKGLIHTPTARAGQEGSTHLKTTAKDTTTKPPRGTTKGVLTTPAKYTSKIQSRTTKGRSSKGGVHLKASPRDREMSACNNQIKSLSSRVTYLRKQLEEIQKENKLLKRIQVRQEKELQNLHGNDGELPKMIHRHNEEVRFYTERLKQMREANDLLNRKLHSSEQSTSRLLEKNSKLKRIAEKKKLLERERLTQKLDATTEDLKKATDRVKDLQHANEVLIKKHAAEYRFLEKKKRTLSDQVDELEEANVSLLKKLKEREKELEILNIYAQKVGRNFPKVQSPALSSKDTQTEVSLSSSRELFSIPPSLSNVSTQTPTMKLKTSSSQTEQVVPKKSDTVFVSEHASTRPGSAADSTQTRSRVQSRESTQEPVQEPSPLPSQKSHLVEQVEKVVQKEQILAQPMESAATMIPKFPSLTSNKTQATDKPQQNKMLASTSGTVHLKNEEDLKKKMLLSKLLNMGTESQVAPSESKAAADIPSSTPAAGVNMYMHQSQPTVPASVNSKTTTTAHLSRQPGTALSAIAPTTSVPDSVTGPSKPWTNLLQVANVTGAATTSSTTVPLATTKPFQSTTATSVPFSTMQNAAPKAATVASPTASISCIQPKSVLTSTTGEPKPNGLTGYHKGSSYAFGSSFTSSSTSKYSTAQPTQAQSTLLQSTLTMVGGTQQNGSPTTTTAKQGVAKNSTRKIDDDKKKELLAKLTAMENLDGTPENKLRTDSKNSSGHSSSSHLWPNTVENLHQGKHAYATENDPYGSRVLGSDSRRGPSLGTGESEKTNASIASGRHFKVDSKPNLIEGTNLKRNTNEYPWENKVDLQGPNKGGGGIFADIMSQSGFSSIQTGQPRTRGFGNAKSNVNSVVHPGQIRTSNTSSLN